MPKPKYDEETAEALLLFGHNMLTEFGFCLIQGMGEALYPRVYQFPDQKSEYHCADLDSVLALARFAHILIRSSTQELMEKAIDTLISAILPSNSCLDAHKRDAVKTILIHLVIAVQRKDG